MSYGIRIVQYVGPTDSSTAPAGEVFFTARSMEGMWLVRCDVDAYDGRGKLDTTVDPNNAARFATMAEAMLYYRRQSSVQPLRADGKPNRPLTAYSVSIEQLPRFSPC